MTRTLIKAHEFVIKFSVIQVHNIFRFTEYYVKYKMYSTKFYTWYWEISYNLCRKKCIRKFVLNNLSVKKIISINF